MTCYLIEWEGVEVGFVAFIPMLNSTGINRYRIARLVILPEFQGLGISSIIMNVFGAMYKAKGIEVTIRTVHPIVGSFLKKSNNWKELSTNNKIVSKKSTLTNNTGDIKKSNITSLGRSAFSYKYIGEEDNDNEIVNLDKQYWKEICQSQMQLF